MKTSSIKNIFTATALICAIFLFGLTIAFAKTNKETKDVSVSLQKATLGKAGIPPPIFHIPDPVPNPDPIKPFIPNDSSPPKRSAETGNANELSSQPLVAISNFKVYPNPSDGKFTLSFQPDLNAAVEIKIADITGKTVYIQNLGSFTGTYSNQIDLSHQGKGIYILSIEQNNERISKKIIIS